MQGFRIIPSLFFPPSDKPIFTATYELPAGTSIERTIEVVEAVDDFIAAGASRRRRGRGPGNHQLGDLRRQRRAALLPGP